MPRRKFYGAQLRGKEDQTFKAKHEWASMVGMIAETLRGHYISRRKIAQTVLQPIRIHKFFGFLSILPCPVNRPDHCWLGALRRLAFCLQRLWLFGLTAVREALHGWTRGRRETHVDTANHDQREQSTQTKKKKRKRMKTYSYPTRDISIGCTS